MDKAYHFFQTGQVATGMTCLRQFLSRERRRLGDGWRSYIESDVRTHAVRELVHRDPFTYRAFSKPRGYAGDAVMMDMIYGYQAAALSSLDALAGSVHAFCAQSPAPAAVRFRRQVLAETIDAVASAHGRRIDVVALAAGHLREADLSVAVREGRAAVTAIDQDEESLDVIRRDYRARLVTAVPGSVRRLVTGQQTLPACDLVYSAGLYDYLPDAVAVRLTTRLFEALRPGGTLLLANFRPDIPDVGYMEAMMDWHLIYRDDAEMLDLIEEISVADIGAIDQFHDPFDNITFLRLTRRGRGAHLPA